MNSKHRGMSQAQRRSLLEARLWWRPRMLRPRPAQPQTKAQVAARVAAQTPKEPPALHRRARAKWAAAALEHVYVP